MDQNLATQLTPQLVAGAVLALFLDLFPKISTTWVALPSRQKQAYNLLWVLIVTIAFIVIPGLVNGSWPVGWDWLLNPLTIFFVTLAGNQSTYIGTRYLTGSSEPK